MLLGLTSTLPISRCFKPCPPTVGATLSPSRSSLLGLSFYLASPPNTHIHTTPDLHTHTAVLSETHPGGLSAPGVLLGVPESQGHLTNRVSPISICFSSALGQSSPWGHQGHLLELLWACLPLLRRSRCAFSLWKWKESYWAKKKRASFVSFLKVSLTVLSCLFFSSWVLFKQPREGGKGEFQGNWDGKESGL